MQDVFRRSSNSPENRKLRDEVTEAVIAHELTHWDKVDEQGGSSRLYDLAFKEAVKQQPELDGKKYAGRRIYGAIIDVTIPDINGGARMFGNLEELEAYITENVYMEQTGRPTYIGKDSQTGYTTRKALYNQLLSGLPLDKYNAVKLLKRTRTQIGGREEWTRFVGQNFAKQGQDPLEVGFDILYAVDGGKVEDFTNLTKKAA